MPLSLLAVVLVAGTSATTEPPRGFAAFPPDREYVYRSVGDVDLKLHVYDPGEPGASSGRPAIVFFFGGGWNTGSPEQFAPHADYLADRGVVAITAEYRVAKRHGVTPRECVADAKHAIRWVRTHAAELGVDPERVAAGGGSAGGHLAAAAGAGVPIDDPAADRTVSARPAALVLFNPVFDNGPDGYGHKRVRDYWRDISPLHNLDADTPTTVVFLGDRDRLVPVATAKAYRDQLRTLGVRCDLHVYAGQGHGFFNHGRDPDYFGETVAEAYEFLRSLGLTPER